MQKLQEQAPARAAGTDGQTTVGEAQHTNRVTGVSYVPNAAITGTDTETRKVSLVNRGQSGVGTTEIAAITFVDGVDAVENDELALTLSVVAGATTVHKGDVLEWVSDSQGATGLADPGGLVQVEIR